MTRQYINTLNAFITLALTQIRKIMPNEGAISRAAIDLIIASLLRPFLPIKLGIATGSVVEHQTGNTSEHVAILIYDTSMVPTYFHGINADFFPIESVLFCIHVIPTLDAASLRHAHASAKSISSYAYWTGSNDNFDKPPSVPLKKARQIAFSIYSETEALDRSAIWRYKEIYDADNTINSIDTICSLGLAYWKDNGQNWMEQRDDGENDALLSLLADILASYPLISASRCPPPLAHYLAPRTPFSTGPFTGSLRDVLFSCTKCKKSGFARPASKIADVIINGTLKHTDSCPKCGSEMRSAPGRYTFANGRLVEATFYSPKPDSQPELGKTHFSLPDYLDRIRVQRSDNNHLR